MLGDFLLLDVSDAEDVVGRQLGRFEPSGRESVKVAAVKGKREELRLDLESSEPVIVFAARSLSRKGSYQLVVVRWISLGAATGVGMISPVKAHGGWLIWLSEVRDIHLVPQQGRSPPQRMVCQALPVRIPVYQKWIWPIAILSLAGLDSAHMDAHTKPCYSPIWCTPFWI